MDFSSPLKIIKFVKKKYRMLINYQAHITIKEASDQSGFFLNNKFFKLEE